jgi:hypothetical protein
MNDEAKLERTCPGYGAACGAKIGARAELCSKCFARRWYAKKQSAAKAAVKSPKKSRSKKAEKASVATVASISTDCDLATLKAKLLRELEAVDTVLALLNQAG